MSELMYEDFSHLSEGFHFTRKCHCLIADLSTRTRSLYIDDDWKIPQRFSKIITDDNRINSATIFLAML